MTRVILQLWSRFRGLFGEESSNREFRDEIETHIALLTETYVRQGMSKSDAMRAAQRQFGNAALLEQRQREARALLWPSTIVQDVRYAFRILAKSQCDDCNFHRFAGARYWCQYNDLHAC